MVPPPYCPSHPPLPQPHPCFQPHRLQAWLWLPGWHRGLPAPPWPQVARGQGPTPGSRCTPSSQAPPGLEKQSSEEEEKEDTTAEGGRLLRHAALPPGTQGPSPQSPSQNSPLNPLGLPTASQHQRGAICLPRGHRAGPQASCCSSEAGPSPNPHPGHLTQPTLWGHFP